MGQSRYGSILPNCGARWMLVLAACRNTCLPPPPPILCLVFKLVLVQYSVTESKTRRQHGDNEVDFMFPDYTRITLFQVGFCAFERSSKIYQLPLI
jgi:hypothetical protein